MVTSSKTIKKIQDLIGRTFLAFTTQIERPDGTPSTIATAYLHAFLNRAFTENIPQTVKDTIANILNKDLPKGEAATYSMKSSEDMIQALLGHLKAKTASTVMGLIRKNNDTYKANALQNINRTDTDDELIKESTLGSLKADLRETVNQSVPEWERTVVTELSDTIGTASVDRIVDDHSKATGQADTTDIYVYRLPVHDGASCKKWCPVFYGKSGEIPVIYKLSTLLSNGTNFGLPSSAWKPVVGATHPNSRTSQIIELKPGWIVGSGSEPTFVGKEKADLWLSEHLRN